MRHGARRRHAGLRAACDFEDQGRRRPAERGHAGISRRGAAFDRVGVAPAAGDAGRRRSSRDRGRDQWRKDCPRGRGRTAAGNFDHRARSFLQYSGAEEISEGGVHRVVAHRVAGYALRAGASRKTFRVAFGDQCHAGRASGGGIQRARVSGIRQRNARPVDSSSRAATARARGIAAASAVAAQGSRRRWRADCAERSRARCGSMALSRSPRFRS